MTKQTAIRVMDILSDKLGIETELVRRGPKDWFPHGDESIVLDKKNWAALEKLAKRMGKLCKIEGSQTIFIFGYLD